MEKILAAKIVSQTFQNSFSKDSFVYFIKSLLNHIDSAPLIYRGNSIPDVYKPYIKTLERIGKYQDKDDKKIDLLIVHLKKKKSLERTRTMQRNFIAWYLNGSRGDILKDAALVAFVSPNSNDWRFSLVRMDYRLDASEGKVKVRQELTPARRFSFLVGKTESSHTAQSCLVPILQDDDSDPTLEDLEGAFSIEKVTEEFFEKYRDLFLKVKEALDEVVKKDKRVEQDFKEKNINSVNFAKKLLGQIIFLYFLQKKGWFGVERDKDWGTGPKNFLRLLFEKRIARYENFFNDILEPLFYEALAVERTDDFYSRFNCKIPFLNGGLFDPINNYDWIHTDILLASELFSNSTKTKQGDIGTGILDIFDRYNFTVKEDEPLEKEVAIDPEMLGKVFENLLEVKDRKSKGTYYTPREIVHYMCQQSLINYLKTETKVEEGKIERVVKQDVLLAKDEYLKWKKEKQKPKNKALALWEGEWEVLDKALENIRIVDPACGSGAFLVGMLQEIVRARKLLQLFNTQKESIYTMKEKSIKNSIYGVDIDAGAIEIAKLRLWLSLIVDEEDIKQIRPLPNLDYKIIYGNSLLEIKKNLLNFPLFDKLEKLKPLFFNETNNRKKQEYKNQIDELIGKITNGHKDFDFEIYFSEVFHEKKGFDIVIGNPPYVEHKKLKQFSPFFKNRFFTYSGTTDLYVYFYEVGLNILKNSGFLTFISSNKFIKTKYGMKLRGLLARNKLCQFIDFTKVHVFDALVASCIVIVSKIKEDSNIIVSFVDDSMLESRDLSEFIKKHHIKLPSKNLSDEIWQLEGQEKTALKLKIEKNNKKLGDIEGVKISRGITTGYNSAFIIDKTLKDKLIDDDRRNKKIIKPLLQGRNIKRWYYAKSNKFLILTGYDLDIPSDFPKVFEFLKQFENELKKRADQGIKWWNLRACTYYSQFEQEKIVWGLTANRWAFAYDNQNYHLPSNAYMLTSSKMPIKYILALLNSKVMRFYFSLIGVMTAGGAFTLKHETIGKLPVSQISQNNQKFIIEVVDKIFAITKDDDYLQNETKQKKIEEYEQKIDKMAYKLYGLTKEEIKIVEAQKI